MDADVLAPLVAVLAGAASVRVIGLRLAFWVLTWIGYRLRQHDDRAPLSAVRIASPGTLGGRAGVAAIGDAWVAVVRLAGNGSNPAAALRALRTLFRISEVPLVSAQLVVWTGPGQRVCWLAVRYRVADAPLAALARGGGERGAQRATVAAAAQLSDLLAAVGCGNAILSAAELSGDLLRALGAREGGKAVEGWRGWADGELSQACFRPAPGHDPALVLSARAPEAAFTVTSLTLRGSGTVRDDLVVRVGARPGGTVADAAAGIGVPLVPLHGRHRTYVRRTLPLAL